jgi:5-methylcytosine-specific restriction endonuclease McrA
MAELAHSQQCMREQMNLLAQQTAKLRQQAELARRARREDLAYEALWRAEALQRQFDDLAAQSHWSRNAERELGARVRQLEAQMDVLRGTSAQHPSAPLGERNTRVIPQDVKIAVAARDGGKCLQCGSAQDLHFDHVIPWSRGGANTVNNIQLLCGPCNRRKGADDIPAGDFTSPRPPIPTPSRIGLEQVRRTTRRGSTVSQRQGSRSVISS